MGDKGKNMANKTNSDRTCHNRKNSDFRGFSTAPVLGKAQKAKNFAAALSLFSLPRCLVLLPKGGF